MHTGEHVPQGQIDAGAHGALEVLAPPDAEIKRKRKAKPILLPAPRSARDWRMVVLAGLLVFGLAGVFFWFFPIRRVEVVMPQPTAAPFPYPTPPQLDLMQPPPTPVYDPAPRFSNGQAVQVLNLTPDVAGYVLWWVLRAQWLPVEQEWIYEVATIDGITLMRAEDQLVAYPYPTPTAG